MGKSCQLSEAERQKIQQWSAAHGTPQQVALRCRIVLAAAAGESDVGIARRLSVNRNTVILWRRRFADEGLDGLWEIAPGRGRKPTYQIDKIAAIVDATLQTKPAGMTHWSCRTMAKSHGVSKSTVNNIWRAHKLQPHRTKTFKLSRDPKFLEKMTDVVGLYLNPPQQAIVLCVDEKSQIQALDRTQPGLPMKKGRCGTHRDSRLRFHLVWASAEGRMDVMCTASSLTVPALYVNLRASRFIIAFIGASVPGGCIPDPSERHDGLRGAALLGLALRPPTDPV
jgi:hypothetical protein